MLVHNTLHETLKQSSLTTTKLKLLIPSSHFTINTKSFNTSLDATSCYTWENVAAPQPFIHTATIIISPSNICQLSPLQHTRPLPIGCMKTPRVIILTRHVTLHPFTSSPPPFTYHFIYSYRKITSYWHQIYYTENINTYKIKIQKLRY